MFEGLRFKHWRWNQEKNGVLHLIIDKDGANANTFSREVIIELQKMIERVEIDPPKAIVISSGKDSGFIAGADITEFESFNEADEVYLSIRRGQKVFDRIERLDCTVVAAIDGFCMGGGTELALACHARIASNSEKTRIGLPEIMLGIHPGWGGTARLPHLIGSPDGLDMILTGRGLRPKVALKKGLVDRIVAKEKLLAIAEERALAGKPKRSLFTQKLTNSFPVRQILASVMRKKVAAKANPKHYPAPFSVIEMWRKHGGNPAKMILAEAKSMVKISQTPTAHNLIRVFLLREKMRKLGDAETANIQNVHVIGAGVMGGDIAAWCALRGLNVTLQDREAQYVEPAIKRAVKLFEKKLKIPSRITETEQRLKMDIEGEGIADADLIIEAIFENLEAKQELFKGLESKMKAGAILASNTSSIPLDELAKVLKQPKNLIGLHFFNPVAKMPLLEIVKHSKLDDNTFVRSAGFAKTIDRLPVPVTGTPGFLVNRILMPYLLEAITLYQEGVPGREIDKAMLRYGMPMGPIELADQVGLDVCASVGQVLSKHLGFVIPDGLDAMLEAGKRGKKDGIGFYQYPEGKAVKPKSPEGYKAPEDITDRMLLPMLNEAVSCLREKVVEDQEMLDAGIIFGTGFAPFRGGPMKYINDTGPAELKAKLESLSEKYGERFKPDAGWDQLST